MEKSFHGRPLCLLCLAAAQEITYAAHSLSQLGELHVKAGYPGQNIFVVTICQCYLPNRNRTEQNHSQSEEINVIDESQAENRPVPVQEAELR